MIYNAIVTFKLAFPGNTILNVGATTLTFKLMFPGTFDLNVEKEVQIVAEKKVQTFVCLSEQSWDNPHQPFLRDVPPHWLQVCPTGG